MHALRDEHLPGLRLAAQPRRQIGHGPDGAVIAPPVEADRAQRRVAVRDTDAEAELVAALVPARSERGDRGAHLERHADRRKLVLGKRDRIVEEDHHAVAGEMLDRALVRHDDAPHFAVVGTQHVHRLLGLGGLGERGKTPQVGEYHRDLAPVGLERVVHVARDDQVADPGRDEALEAREPLELRHLLGDAALQPRVQRGELVVERLHAQQRLHARHQLHLVDGLGKEVVCPGLEALDPLLARVERRDQHDR